MLNPTKNFALLLLFAAALALFAACGDDDDDGGISLSGADSTDEEDDGSTATEGETPSVTATEVTGTTIVGTVPLDEESFVEAFTELRVEIEEDLDPSPLEEEEGLDELVSDCAGEDDDPDSTSTPPEDDQLAAQAQLDSCIALLELLVSKDEPDLEPLIDLTADFAIDEFPDDEDEINEAAGREPATPSPTP